MLQLLLVRHAESEKNIGEKFDGNPSLDRLTEDGRRSVQRIASALDNLSKEMSIKIFCANSGRAKETAELLAPQEHEPLIIDSFGSMNSGPFSGLDDSQLAASFPDFFQDLQLFRAGVLSGYALRTPDGAERWVDFERKISTAIGAISKSSSDLCIIVCHRSAMIALYNHFARSLLDYPNGHLGFMNTPPLTSALIRPSSTRDRFIVGSCWELLAQVKGGTP